MPPDPIWSQLLLQFILILVNAFFAATEIAVISLNENKLRRQMEDGDKKAGKLLQMMQSPSRFLSTIQVGITLAGFLGSAFAANSFSNRLVYWATSAGVNIPPRALTILSIIVITLILAYFTLVLGELVPKRIAMQNPEKVARFSCSIILFVAAITKPIVWFLSISTSAVLKIFRVNDSKQSDNVTEEEIRLLVDIGEEKGVIEAGEKEMIENVFEFNNMTAEDAMTHRTDVTAIWINDSVDDIICYIEQSGLSRFPVYDEDIDDIVGIMSTREYLLNARRESPKPLTEILRSAFFVPESIKTDDLFREMQTQKVHMAIVVDEYGGMSGIVTMEDLLEMIVGNIYDEFDPLEEQDIINISDNLWRVNGSVDLQELSKALDIEIPENDEYDTLGGLVYSGLTTIPKDGSKPSVDVFGLHIEVEQLSDRRVEWAVVSIIKPVAEDDLENTADPDAVKE